MVLMKGKLTCAIAEIWNKDGSPPDACKKRGCKGWFKKFPPMLEDKQGPKLMQCFTFADGLTWEDMLDKKKGQVCPDYSPLDEDCNKCLLDYITCTKDDKK